MFYGQSTDLNVGIAEPGLGTLLDGLDTIWL